MPFYNCRKYVACNFKETERHSVVFIIMVVIIEECIMGEDGSRKTQGTHQESI